jgi:hypothetical protein
MKEISKEFTAAFDLMVKELRDDQQYYYAWQSNIAMQFQDEMSNKGYRFPDLHEISNNAAKNFLNLLITKIDK